MSFTTHKRVEDKEGRTATLCGSRYWISAISVDHLVDCKECLVLMKKEESKAQ